MSDNELVMHFQPETLRRWPAEFRLIRKCVKDYRLSDGRGRSMTINRNDTVMLPIVGLHMDPAYHPEPHKFDPERFSAERIHLIRPFTYLPFGSGPRSCLGELFA